MAALCSTPDSHRRVVLVVPMAGIFSSWPGAPSKMVRTDAIGGFLPWWASHAGTRCGGGSPNLHPYPVFLVYLAPWQLEQSSYLDLKLSLCSACQFTSWYWTSLTGTVSLKHLLGFLHVEGEEWLAGRAQWWLHTQPLSMWASGPCSDPPGELWVGGSWAGPQTFVCVSVPNTGRFWAPHPEGFWPPVH